MSVRTTVPGSITPDVTAFVIGRSNAGAFERAGMTPQARRVRRPGGALT